MYGGTEHMNKKFATILLMLMFGTTSVLGGFILTEENDAFTGSDDYYTQGLELMWINRVRTSGVPVRHRGYGLKNIFYTPEDIESSEAPPQTDRPWAGYSAVSRKDWKRTKDYTRTVDWMVGVAGDWSYSEEIQSWWHDITKSKTPEGWGHQIPEEPIVNVTIEYYKPLWVFQGQPSGWGIDVAAMAGGSFGTAFINGEVGTSLRAGWNLPPYWSGIIKPTVLKRYSFFALAEQAGRVVGHNVTLGGSLFQSGPSRDLEPFVSDSVLGCGFVVGNIYNGTDLGLMYRRLWRSDEFEGQKKSSDSGSVTFSLLKSF